MTLILEVSDLNKTFGAVIAAQDINVTVHEHEVIGIIGANGAGKTTFINMVTGYLKPTSGQIKFAGRSIVGLKPPRYNRFGHRAVFSGAAGFRLGDRLRQSSHGLRHR